MFNWLGVESLAVVLSVAYLLLAMRENSLCWYCAFASAALYIWIFGDVSLYMESALNGYYMAMAVYGWYQWRRGGVTAHGIKLSRWTAAQHVVAIAVILTVTLISGYWLSVSTAAKLPYIDSFTSWASVVTTIMVARKILENWLYWIVIDSVSLFMYLDRGLYQTAALFLLYLGLAVIGYCVWRKHYFQDNPKTTTANAV